MIHTITIAPGITLRCIPERRFRNGTLSIQLVRPMCREEAALNALLPEVLLRGCRAYPDLRQITWRLDELYGSAVGAQLRRVGDYQTTGLYADFLEDRFIPEQEGIFEPMLRLLRQLLTDPLLEAGVFRSDYVESEKQKLRDHMEARRADKQAYAHDRLMEQICREDSYGVPRLGRAEDVADITPERLFAHYQRILRESRIEVFYVGAVKPQVVAEGVRGLFADVQRDWKPLPPQSGLKLCPGSDRTQSLPMSQGRLCMGYVCRGEVPPLPVMQLLNLVLGGDQTGKLFRQLRQERSLCYAVDTAYFGCKGILTVSTGLDSAMEQPARHVVEAQIQQCRKGNITPEELSSARQALRASLLSVEDSPVHMEHYFSAHALSDGNMDIPEHIRALDAVSVEQLADAARSLTLHSVFFLKGGAV